MRDRETAVDVALLCIRVALGAVFIAHGWQKFAGGSEGMAKFAENLSSMGVPLSKVMAYVTAIWELGGGALVVLGLFTRVAALGLVVIMGVAVFMVHLKNGFFLQNPGGGYEYAMVLGLIALALVIAGAGRISIDRKLFKRKIAAAVWTPPPPP